MTNIVCLGEVEPLINFIRKYISLQILFIAVATAIFGELRIVPFGWEFRFGLGSSMFFLLLLLMNNVPMLRTGVVTGMVVVLFRTLTGRSFIIEPSLFWEVLVTHVPAMFYYIAFAFGMSRIPKQFFQSRLFLLGIIVTFVDFYSNMVEIGFRKILIETTSLSLTEWMTFLLVACIRVFFVIGLYANIILKQLQAVHFEQQKRYEHTLSVGASLYSESFYMKKIMDEIENLTLSSYDHYRSLKKERLYAHSKHALSIAEGIHEIKKDAQRIRAGLLKLHNDTELNNEMLLSDIIDFVIRANQQYSKWLQKEIEFSCHLHVNYLTSHHLLLLTALNNLAANGVEAIEGSGSVRIRVSEQRKMTIFQIEDTGEGIKEGELPYIFVPGYTTKYDQRGVAATGIGLSHVNNIVEGFNGEITVNSIEGEGTSFVMKILTAKLKVGE